MAKHRIFDGGYSLAISMPHTDVLKLEIAVILGVMTADEYHEYFCEDDSALELDN